MHGLVYLWTRPLGLQERGPIHYKTRYVKISDKVTFTTLSVFSVSYSLSFTLIKRMNTLPMSLEI